MVMAAGNRGNGSPGVGAVRRSLVSSRLFVTAPEVPERWFVLHTHSRQEKALAETLQARGIKSFLPLVRGVRYYGHRRRVSQRPLFPSYVFLWGSLEETYFAVSTKRVTQVLTVVDQDRLDRELYSIRLALVGDATLDPYPFLAVGKRARVTAGPLRGVEGLIQSRPSETRLVLCVHTLGQAVSTEIDPALLEPAE